MKQCKICWCTESQSCKNGCYRINNNLCSNCKDRKKDTLKYFEDLHNKYAWKAIDFEEAGKMNKWQDMVDITDKIEKIVEFIEKY